MHTFMTWLAIVSCVLSAKKRMNIRWWLIVFISFLLGLFFHMPFPDLYIAIQKAFLNVNHLFVERLKDGIHPSMEAMAGSPKIGFVGDFVKLVNELGILLLLALLFVLIFFLFDAIRPWKHNRETVIQFMDLRPDVDQKIKAGRAAKLSKNNHLSGDRAITELFAASLRQIISIHDLAYQYCRVHFRNQEIYSSRTCVDMTSVWSQVEIKSLFFEEPSRLAIGSSPFNDDLGQISSKVGPVEASFSLIGLMQILQSRNADNIYISGSLQNHGDDPRVVSQLAVGKQSWAWDMSYEMIKHSPDCANPKIPDLLKELAYHVTNRIMGQTSQLIDVLPGDHFEKYSKLLSEFVKFIQSDPPDIHTADHQLSKKVKEDFERLKQALDTFLAAEPTDLRSYYMLYIIGIIAIGRREFKVARDYLRKASNIEPFVVASIFRAGLSPKQLKWNRVIAQGLPNQTSPKNQISKPDRIRAFELARGLANVNAALGFSLEQSLQLDINLSSLDVRLCLEDAASAYHRAFDYKSDDPLFLSNQAEVKLKLSDLLQPKDLYLDHRLRLRTEAQQLLGKACRMKKNDHQKYAWLRMGHYQLRRGDLIQAADFFKRAWDADPSFLVAARNLANTYSMRGDPDKAIQICNQALHEVSGNRSHYLTTKQIHAWIHNSRGWAYLRKAIKLRKEHRLDALTLTECKTWLHIADNNFQEAINLMEGSPGQESIPMINKLFTFWEIMIFDKGYLGDDFLSKLYSTLERMPKGNHFTKIYQSLSSPDSKEFASLFQVYWKNHTFVPSEYLGLIADLQMLKDYLEARWDIASIDEKTLIDQLVGNIDDALNEINSSLPSCFLGLHYLWSGHPDRASDCWQKRLEELKCLGGKQPSASTHKLQAKVCEITSVALNYELWSYLYQGLVAIFSESKEHRFPSASLDLFKQVLAADQSSSSRQYALDLMAEARAMGDTLIRRGQLRERRQLILLRLLFAPVNRRYDYAVKHDILNYVRLRIVYSAEWVLKRIDHLYRAMEKWLNILLSS